MKILKFALLSSAMLSLVGCGDSNCKITFNGENCFIRNEAGEEFTTLSVGKNSAINLQIFVKDNTNYLIPREISVTDGVAYHYYPNSSQEHSAGDLEFPSINCNVTITAVAMAKGDVTYSVKYPEDPNATWSGPTEVNIGEKLTATVKPAGELVVDKAYVYIGGNPCYDFTFTNNTLTIPEGVITNNVLIRASAHRPGATYEVKFNVANAKPSSDFPTQMLEGDMLVASFVANDGYRLPIQDGTPRCEEFAIYKDATGDRAQHVAMEPFDYETLTGDYIYYVDIDEQTQVKYAQVIIFPYTAQGSNIDTISFEGKAIKQLQVNFDPNGGKWADGTDVIKTAYVDDGQTLEDAENKCGANVQPHVDDITKRCAGYFDQREGGTEITSTTPIPDTPYTVYAQYEDIYYYIDKEFTNASGTGFLEKVKYHEAVSGTITANAGYTLPSSITVLTYEESQLVSFTDFKYVLDPTLTSASFTIDAGHVEGNIIIYVTATKDNVLTFDPGAGTWDGKDDKTPKKATFKSGDTYNEVFASLGVNNPTSDDANLHFDGWAFNGSLINMADVVPNTSFTITASYSDTTFENDSWANVIKYADEGTLSVRYPDEAESLFIGAIRHLYIDGIDYKVQVIGYNQDTISSSGKKAPLTFEFVNIVNPIENSEEVLKPYNVTGKNTWAGSDYQKYLNGAFYTKLKEDNTGFVAKTVSKKTAKGYNGEVADPTVITTDETIFPLSGAEIGLPSTNGETNPVAFTAPDGLGPQGKNAYYYYQIHYLDKACRLKYNQNTQAASYWLRSNSSFDYPPNPPESMTGDTTNAYFISAGGSMYSTVGNYYKTFADADYGYMAAFCI